MRKMKVISLILALAMVVTVFAACGSDGGSGSGSSDEAYRGEVKDLGEGKDYYNGLEYPKVSDDTLNLTMHLHSGTNIFDDEAWEVYNAEGVKSAYTLTNVKIHGTASKANTNSDQEFTKMLLESTLPDIIHGSRDQINDAGVNQNAMIPLDRYVINSDYMPSLTKIYTEHPDYYESTRASDGHIYYLPKLRQEGATQGWYTRSDWMKKLGKSDPVTFKDFEDLLYAFRNEDPNGNGKVDEVPYFGDVKYLFYFFGLNGRVHDINENDEYYCAFITDEYRNAIEHVAKWFADGLIDKEYYSRKDPRKDLWSTNVGGITFNWFSSTMSFNEQITNVPGFHISVMRPPENINGEAYCHSPGEIVCSTGWGISKSNQHVVETLRYLDFWYSDYGSLLNAMGIEGRDWNYDDAGEPHYTEYATNQVGGAPSYVRKIGCVDVGYYMHISWLLDGMTDEAREGNLDYIENVPCLEGLPVLTYDDKETETIRSLKTNVEGYIKETQTKWITGVEPLNDDTWNAYLDQTKKLGVDELTAAYNSAYTRYKEGLKVAKGE